MKRINSKPTQTRSTPVRALRYAQAQGFSDVEDLGAELGIELADGCEVDQALVAEGWMSSRYPYEQHGDSDFASVRVYRNEAGDKFVVDLDLSDAYEYVLVEGRSNFMALRVALAPIIQLGLFEKMMAVGPAFAVRAFIHQHRHPPLYPCKTCETEEERAQRLALDKRYSAREAEG
jgi:hypothetical protein